jgi:hypothetical protein
MVTAHNLHFSLKKPPPFEMERLFNPDFDTGVAQTDLRLGNHINGTKIIFYERIFNSDELNCEMGGALSKSGNCDLFSKSGRDLKSHSD